MRHGTVAATLAARVSRRFVLHQRIRYLYSAPVTNLHQQLKVVPPSTHGSQRRGHWQLTVDGVRSSSLRTSVDPFGNITVDIRVPRVDDAVEFVLDVEVDADHPARPPDLHPDRRYLRATRLTTPDDAITELTSGTERHDVASLCEQVHRALAYEWGVTGIRTTASEALASGRGVCQDFAHVMLAACRSVGMPARYVSGHLTGEGGSHAWVEVLRPDPVRRGRWAAQGWDPTHNRRTGDDYLVVAVGRDYADVAPLSGTYEGARTTNTLSVEKRLDCV